MLKQSALFLAAVAAITCTSCSTTSTADNIPVKTVEAPMSAMAETYDVPLDKAWSTAQEIFEKYGVIRILDKEKGLMVTEPMVIDDENNEVIRKTFMTRSWEETYRLRFKELSPTQTEITVDAKIHSTWNRDTQIVDEKYAALEDTLQTTLFKKLDAALK